MVVIAFGLVSALALTFWIGKSWPVRAGIFGALAAGIGFYAYLGAPNTPDLPLAGRLESLREMDPQKVTAEQWIALLNERAQEDPEDPLPFKFIGDILIQQGKVDEAITAYQTALRRDPQYVEALTPLADALVAREGRRVTEQAQQIYMAAFAANTRDVTAAFMPGMKFWLEGDREGARAWWAEAKSLMSPNAPETAEFATQVEMLENAMAAVARPENEILAEPSESEVAEN